MTVKILSAAWAQTALIFVLGMMSALAFAPYFVVPVLALGLAVLFRFINTAPTKKRAVWLAFVFGFGLGATSLSWISNALMVDGGQFAVLIPVALAGFGLLFGIFYALPAAGAVFFRAGYPRLCAWVGFFVLSEWVRSWIFTGFPWNLVGAVWTNCPPMVQSAALWGVYGLSGATVLMFSVLAFVPRSRPVLMACVLGMVLYAGGALRLYNVVPENVWGVTVRMVQPNIPQTLKWNPEQAQKSIATLINLSRENNDKITHVIWPETAIPFLPDIHESERVRLMGAIRQGGTLIAGALRGANPASYQLANSVFIFDDLVDIKGFYDKSHLVPFGEYVPLRGLLPFDKIVPVGSDFVAGAGPRTVPVPKAPPASLLVCYEIIFPHAVVDEHKRPEWIINVTNDAWYGISAGPHQHLGITQLRAVEEGLPIARATNNGISAMIDPYGRILASKPLGEQAVLDTPLPRPAAKTIYATLGNGVPLGIAIALILFSVRKRKITLDK